LYLFDNWLDRWYSRLGSNMTVLESSWSMDIQEIIYGGKVHTGPILISNQIYGFHDDDDGVVVVYLHSHFPKKHRESCSSKISEPCHDTPQVILDLLILLVCCM